MFSGLVQSYTNLNNIICFFYLRLLFIFWHFCLKKGEINTAKSVNSEQNDLSKNRKTELYLSRKTQVGVGSEKQLR